MIIVSDDPQFPVNVPGFFLTDDGCIVSIFGNMHRPLPIDSLSGFSRHGSFRQMTLLNLRNTTGYIHHVPANNGLHQLIHVDPGHVISISNGVLQDNPFRRWSMRDGRPYSFISKPDPTADQQTVEDKYLMLQWQLTHDSCKNFSSAEEHEEIQSILREIDPKRVDYLPKTASEREKECAELCKRVSRIFESCEAKSQHYQQVVVEDVARNSQQSILPEAAD